MACFVPQHGNYNRPSACSCLQQMHNCSNQFIWCKTEFTSDGRRNSHHRTGREHVTVVSCAVVCPLVAYGHYHGRPQADRKHKCMHQNLQGFWWSSRHQILYSQQRQARGGHGYAGKEAHKMRRDTRSCTSSSASSCVTCCRIHHCLRDAGLGASVRTDPASAMEGAHAISTVGVTAALGFDAHPVWISCLPRLAHCDTRTQFALAVWKCECERTAWTSLVGLPGGAVHFAIWCCCHACRHKGKNKKRLTKRSHPDTPSYIACGSHRQM